jgi:hypothetical protein
VAEAISLYFLVYTPLLTKPYDCREEVKIEDDQIHHQNRPDVLAANAKKWKRRIPLGLHV